MSSSSSSASSSYIATVPAEESFADAAMRAAKELTAQIMAAKATYTKPVYHAPAKAETLEETKTKIAKTLAFNGYLGSAKIKIFDSGIIYPVDDNRTLINSITDQQLRDPKKFFSQEVVQLFGIPSSRYYYPSKILNKLTGEYYILPLFSNFKNVDQFGDVEQFKRDYCAWCSLTQNTVYANGHVTLKGSEVNYASFLKEYANGHRVYYRTKGTSYPESILRVPMDSYMYKLALDSDDPESARYLEKLNLGKWYLSAHPIHPAADIPKVYMALVLNSKKMIQDYLDQIGIITFDANFIMLRPTDEAFFYLTRFYGPNFDGFSEYKEHLSRQVELAKIKTIDAKEFYLDKIVHRWQFSDSSALKEKKVTSNLEIVANDFKCLNQGYSLLDLANARQCISTKSFLNSYIQYLQIALRPANLTSLTISSLYRQWQKIYFTWQAENAKANPRSSGDNSVSWNKLSAMLDMYSDKEICELTGNQITHIPYKRDEIDDSEEEPLDVPDAEQEEMIFDSEYIFRTNIVYPKFPITAKTNLSEYAQKQTFHTLRSTLRDYLLTNTVLLLDPREAREMCINKESSIEAIPLGESDLPVVALGSFDKTFTGYLIPEIFATFNNNVNERGIMNFLRPDYEKSFTYMELRSLKYIIKYDTRLALYRDEMLPLIEKYCKLFEDQNIALSQTVTRLGEIYVKCSPEMQTHIDNVFLNIFYMGAYARQWKGPGNPYPILASATGVALESERSQRNADADPDGSNEIALAQRISDTYAAYLNAINKIDAAQRNEILSLTVYKKLTGQMAVPFGRDTIKTLLAAFTNHRPVSRGSQPVRNIIAVEDVGPADLEASSSSDTDDESESGLPRGALCIRIASSALIFTGAIYYLRICGKTIKDFNMNQGVDHIF